MMNEIDPSKYINIINRNNNKKDNNKLKYYLKKFGIKILLVAVIFLGAAIACQSSNTIKNKINSYVFTEAMSFTKMKKVYNKYLGGVLPIKMNTATEKVFKEKLNYNNLSIYHDGVLLDVTDSYLVPSLREGMVVFIGDKEHYGNTVIIEDLDGIYNWYGNINNTSLKLYDYIEEGSYIGEVNNKLYLVFSKDNKYLDYEEYIK